MNRISLGKRIKKARISAGLTQEETAEYIGVSRAAVARWEQGEIEPRLKHLYALTQLFHVTSDYLLGIKSNDYYPVDIALSSNAVESLNHFIHELLRTHHEKHLKEEEE